MKIRIVVPMTNHSTPMPAFLQSVDRLIAGRPDIVWEYVPVYSTEIGMGRSAGIRAIYNPETKTFIEDSSELCRTELPDYTGVLSLDSDMAFTVDAFNLLLQVYLKVKTVVCGVFQSRFDTNCVYAGKFIDGRVPLIDHAQNLTIAQCQQQSLSKNVIVCKWHWSSFGFSFISRDVLQNLDAPWFGNYVTNYINSHGKKCYRYIHEDIAFSEQLFRSGIPLYVVPKVFVTHLIG